MGALIRPSERIWAMLSGYAYAARHRRLMVMLQAYVDDSGRGQSPVFVLAGFISSPEKWALFSDEWAAVLAARPGIDYFKMREAHSFKGQFEGWNPGSRDAKISDLSRIIEKYMMAGISLSITIEEYNDIFAPITHKAARSPYFLAVFNMISMLARYQIDMKLHEKVDFIFDRQDGQSGPIMDAWEWFKNNATDDTKDQLGSPPDFRDDKNTMPLQAADLYAWWVRRRQWEKETNTPILASPWTSTNKIPSLMLDFTRAQLEQMRDIILARINSAITFSYGRFFYRQV
jgi:hypothetical protein